eukprot:COSAG06_NODE_1044_length_10979_cov_10.105331_7_plen_161_part_00
MAKQDRFFSPLVEHSHPPLPIAAHCKQRLQKRVFVSRFPSLYLSRACLGKKCSASQYKMTPKRRLNRTGALTPGTRPLHVVLMQGGGTPLESASERFTGCVVVVAVENTGIVEFSCVCPEPVLENSSSCSCTKRERKRRGFVPEARSSTVQLLSGSKGPV